jgi:enoyl-CoA hydratase
MGLANRLVEPGRAPAAAVELAHQLARFPQGSLRSDRLSAYEQASLPWAEALRNELRRGLALMDSGEAAGGAARFAAGAGRHGAFE